MFEFDFDEKMNRVFVFPGQGIQRQGMGKSILPHFPKELAEAESILGYSIRELCFENPKSRLTNTRYAQPALFAVCALGFLKRKNEGKLCFFAGHSLGEYAALFAAGVFDFATGMRLVEARGKLMSEVSGGGMSAILGLTYEKIKFIIADSGFSEIDIANQNSPLQTVIAGPRTDLESANSILSKAGAKVISLDVSGAFHSRQMRPAAKRFGEFLRGFSFHPPQVPVIANVTAKPYLSSEIAETLTRQIHSPVLWESSIRYILNQGETSFEEIGGGRVLTNLIRQIRSHENL